MFETKRKQWVDVARGGAMLLVIIGHLGMRNSLVQWIYSFHMPLFFIITGIIQPAEKFGGGQAFTLQRICC